MAESFWYRIKNYRDFRIKLFLLLSLVCNFVYALFLFIVSQVNASQWFFIMSIYYGLLFLVRLFMFVQSNPQKSLRSKIKVMQVSGYFLTLLNIVVSVMMFVLIYTTQCVKHHEITVIALATYTFSSLTIAILSSIKHLRGNNYVYSCIKVISLISASVSMVTLTNTMLATWGDETMLLRDIILPILSGVVSIFIIVCAVLLIRKANLDLKVLKNEEKRE